MICPNCGKEIGDNNFCPNCGASATQKTDQNQSQIVCPNCGSHNVSVQVMQDTAKTKGHGHERGLLWTLVRWTLILCTCGLWLLVGKSKGKDKSKTKFKNSSVAVCQSCGYSWKLSKVK